MKKVPIEAEKTTIDYFARVSSIRTSSCIWSLKKSRKIGFLHTSEDIAMDNLNRSLKSYHLVNTLTCHMTYTNLIPPQISSDEL